MSRSKTGLDKEPRNDTPQSANESRTATPDERPGQGYPTGRESWREFPRRSNARRERLDYDRSEDDRLNLDNPRSAQPRDRYRSDIQSSTSRDYRDVVSGRAWTPRRDEGYGQAYGRYGDRSAQHYSGRDYTEPDYGRHSYDDLARGRADHEDFPRYGREDDRENFRGYGRDNFPGYRRHELPRDSRSDYGNDYRQERRDYDEPYNRQATGGRYEAEMDYPYGSPDRAFTGPTTWTNRGYESAGDYRERGYGAGRNLLRSSEVMTKNVTTCHLDTVIRDVADMMEDENVGSIPVVDNGRLLGIITDRDIVCRVIAEGLDTRTAKAREVMSEDIITCTPDDSVIDAIRKMGEHQIRRIPVCDLNGRLRGIISLGDIALEAERDRDLANALEQISQPTPFQSRRV
ncbi:MAG TPA: CBS domain-containing protein [Blastocatellia bacterium]|nr:CBS domain-containing protein [Blastocatellia bacterium]